MGFLRAIMLSAIYTISVMLQVTYIFIRINTQLRFLPTVSCDHGNSREKMISTLRKEIISRLTKCFFGKREKTIDFSSIKWES